ncbi:hypothetical protein SCAR479_06491 [Seiridium cardinale]|uniref:Uncharacterized protein n=1 Tax=Seiridium cardinale TaxID=138064 RepID=A0ABR2XSI2_9PEZI
MLAAIFHRSNRMLGGGGQYLWMPNQPTAATSYPTMTPFPQSSVATLVPSAKCACNSSVLFSHQPEDLVTVISMASIMTYFAVGWLVVAVFLATALKTAQQNAARGERQSVGWPEFMFFMVFYPILLIMWPLLVIISLGWNAWAPEGEEAVEGVEDVEAGSKEGWSGTSPLL